MLLTSHRNKHSLIGCLLLSVPASAAALYSLTGYYVRLSGAQNSLPLVRGENDMSNWESFVDAYRTWIGLVVWLHVAGFWLLLFLGLMWRRQVRCLHFCFIGISDWGINKLQEVRDYYIEEHGRDNSPFLDIEKEWKAKIDYYAGLQKRASIRVPKDNHIDYIMEDLR
jgi:hypothetical protein